MVVNVILLVIAKSNQLALHLHASPLEFCLGHDGNKSQMSLASKTLNSSNMAYLYLESLISREERWVKPHNVCVNRRNNLGVYICHFWPKVG